MSRQIHQSKDRKEKTTVVFITLFKMFSIPVMMHPQIYLKLDNQQHNK